MKKINPQVETLKENFWTKISFKPAFFFWTLFFSLLAVTAPVLLAHVPKNQLLVGTIVNASLFGAVWQVGWLGAVWVAILPSSAALIKGTLPSPMAMLIPFIIISNLILISVFQLLPKKNLFSIFLSAGLKFLFLFSVMLFFSNKIPANFLTMLSWPQLVTALSGGIIVWLIKKFSTKNQSKTN